MITPSKNPEGKQQELYSIIQLVAGPEAQNLDEQQIFFSEFQFFNELMNEKILEKEDRQKIQSFKKLTYKRFLLANVLSAVLNRGLTKIKYKRFDFMNQYFIIRFIIRLGIFGFLNFSVFANQFSDLFDLRNNLNDKYIPRYRDYMTTGGHPMGCMNKNFMNDPDVSQDEKEMVTKFQKMNSSPMMAGLGPRI